MYKNMNTTPRSKTKRCPNISKVFSIFGTIVGLNNDAKNVKKKKRETCFFIIIIFIISNRKNVL